MSYIGDFRLGDTLDTKFCTVATTGAPTTLAGTPVISAYVGNSTTQLTAGITLSVDFDGVTGMHNVRVVASGGNGYATASNYQLVITTGTVGGTSVVGYVVAEFSIEARSALMPTTAALTLDVSAGGEAGVDWANVGGKTTSNALTGTTIATTQKVDVDTIKTNPVVNGGTITFPTNATLASTANITAGTITTVTNLTNAATAGDFTATMKTSIGTAVAASAVASVTGNVGGNVTGTVGSVVGAVGSVTGNVGGNVTGSVGSVAGNVGGNVVGTVASLTTPGNIWDVVLASHVTAGSTGFALNAAGAAGDPWSTSLPGAYGAGTAGFIVGTDLDATVSSRLASASYSAPLSAAGTRTAIGLASANLDTQLDALPTALENADALLDRSDAIETGLTPRQAIRLEVAAAAGKLSGAATTTVTIRNAVQDSKNRIVATVDADGNRTAITTNVS